MAPHPGRQHNPRVLAALAYAFPIVPALVLLIRERRNHFIRAHAALALIFFAALLLAQIAFWLVLIGAGSITPDLRFNVVAGLAILVLGALFGLISLLTWLRLIRAALAGRILTIPLLTPLAKRLYRLLTRVQRR
ncbi:MAG: hypothetical protein OJF49_001499 [Ktedonobacterales bacterium]|jgi:uncharacterized membrane protein|nr:MAG: hypothetical protein OJF49_001499 [Ktedonobacterales bacterium]